MRGPILAEPAARAAQLEAERYGISADLPDPTDIYGHIADVLELELLDPTPPTSPTLGCRPRHRRSAARTLWAGLVPVERVRALVRAQGACRDSGIEFFPDPDGLSEAAHERACDTALSVCDGCPVRVECAELAIRTDERWGIWGGMTADERALEVARRTSHRRLTEREAS